MKKRRRLDSVPMRKRLEKKMRQHRKHGHNFTFRDTDGRMLEVFVQGNVTNPTQLFRRKAIHEHCVRQGLSYPKRQPDPSLQPDPDLADRISNMTMLEWLQFIEVLVGWKVIERGHYYVDRWSDEEE